MQTAKAEISQRICVADQTAGMLWLISAFVILYLDSQISLPAKFKIERQ